MIELINKKDKLELTKPTGGTSVTVDSELSLESTNPVENRVITNKINEIEDSIPEVDWDYIPGSPNAQSGNAVQQATDTIWMAIGAVQDSANAIVERYQQLSKTTLSEISYEELWRMLQALGGLIFDTRGQDFEGAYSKLQLPAGAYVAYYNSGYDVASCWNLETGVLYKLNGWDLFDNGELYFYVNSPFVELQNSVGNINSAIFELRRYAQALITGGATE